MFTQRSSALDESQFEEIRCRWVKVSLQVALTGICEVCMIMEPSYLHRLHTPATTRSMAQHSPTHSLLLPLYSSLDLFSSLVLFVTLALDCHRKGLWSKPFSCSLHLHKCHILLEYGTIFLDWHRQGVNDASHQQSHYVTQTGRGSCTCMILFFYQHTMLFLYLAGFLEDRYKPSHAQ